VRSFTGKQKYQHNGMSSILPPHEKSDMVLVGEIPTMFATRQHGLANELLDSIVLWYHPGMNETAQVYWSENHALMCMSSDLLLHQLAGRPIPDILVSRLVRALSLKATLGIAEFMSPVYLPFTIVALLNLYDLCTMPTIRSLAHDVLNHISTRLLAVALEDGSICSPSARSYARHRETGRGHHLTLFLDYLLTGHVSLGDPSQALARVLPLTTYQGPPRVETEDTFSLSPSLDSLLEAIDDFPDDEFLTHLWSHGVFVPPTRAAVTRVLRVMDTYDLWSHPHFSALKPVRRVLCCGRATIVHAIARLPGLWPRVHGARLTGATLSVFREGKVVLSSLGRGYNAGLPCYQQWPWAVNLAGVPIWCSAGGPSTAGLVALGNAEAAHELSSSRVMPAMFHKDRLLMADYSLHVLGSAPTLTMRFPDLEFHSHGTHETWTWARRESAWVAFRISGLVVTVVVGDSRYSDMRDTLSA
jgi:hypothetical protein